MSPPQCTEDNDSEHDDTIFELLEKIPTLKGVKLPKNKQQWETANLYFQQHLP